MYALIGEEFDVKVASGFSRYSLPEFNWSS